LTHGEALDAAAGVFPGLGIISSFTLRWFSLEEKKY